MPPPSNNDLDLKVIALDRARDALAWRGVNKEGKPLRSCPNTAIAIKRLGVECRYDEFHDRLLVRGDIVERYDGELTDHVCALLRVVIGDKFGFDPGRDHVFDAAVQLCLLNKFDPVCDYLDGLEWDGVSRIDTWLSDYLSADRTVLNNAISRLALVAAVRRARVPGCKFDQIIVLEGVEGTMKSTAVLVLAGEENFSDQTILGLNDQQQQERLRGRWLYEIADLSGMERSEVEHIKAFASRTRDRARPAYGRCLVEQPRRCVLFATTNADAYLRSQTAIGVSGR
jgi:predicted P-loop ATPase